MTEYPEQNRRYRSGGWLGLHCESSLNMFLMVLLLWEEVFDDRVQAALPHVITVRKNIFSQRTMNALLVCFDLLDAVTRALHRTHSVSFSTLDHVRDSERERTMSTS